MGPKFDSRTFESSSGFDPSKSGFKSSNMSSGEQFNPGVMNSTFEEGSNQPKNGQFGNQQFSMNNQRGNNNQGNNQFESTGSNFTKNNNAFGSNSFGAQPNVQQQSNK